MDPRSRHLMQQRFWAAVKAEGGRAFQAVKQNASAGGSRPPTVVAAVPGAAPLPSWRNVEIEAVVEVVHPRADGAFEQIVAAVVAPEAIVVACLGGRRVRMYTHSCKFCGDITYFN